MSKQLNFPSSQSGVGLIGVIIAIGGVLLLSLAISSFLNQQRRASVKLESNALCDQILSSVISDLTTDNNSLFITSYGPQGTSPTYPSGRDKTKDNVDRLSFAPGGIQALYGPTGTPNTILIGGSPKSDASNIDPAPVPTGYKFTNSLNIKNSINRLTALAYTHTGMCCPNLDTMNANTGSLSPTCGMVFTPSSIASPNFRVLVGVNFSNPQSASPFCPSTTPNLPVAADGVLAHVRVQVFERNTEDTESIAFCSGGASASFGSDLLSPLVIMGKPNISQVGGQYYMCGNPGVNIVHADVDFQVKTVTNRNPTAQSCQTCLANLPRPSATAQPDPIAECYAGPSSPCKDVDPGSIFLCRIGEKNWFDNNKNHWEPCNQTKVWGCTGGIAPDSCTGKQELGKVSISYDYNSQVNPSVTALGTSATITLSDLVAHRAYEVDVRAVDTQGRFLGTSFEGAIPINENSYTGGPTFVTTILPPTLGPLGEDSPLIDTAGKPEGATPRDAKYYQEFGGDLFQCKPGTVEFSADVSYPSMPPYVYQLLHTEKCTMSANKAPLPSGGSTLPGMQENPDCTCSMGRCSGTVNVNGGGVNATPGPGGVPINSSEIAGNWTASMTVRNICMDDSSATLPSATASLSWCFQGYQQSGLLGLQITASLAMNKQDTDSPVLVLNAPGSGVSYLSGARSCPISMGVGHVTGGGSIFPVLSPGETKNIPLTDRGWVPKTHSGCVYDQTFLGYNVDNASSMATDVCGMQQTVSTHYQSKTAIDGSHSCRTAQELLFGWYADGGNSCVNGAFCNQSYSCQDINTYGYTNSNCYYSTSGNVPNNDGLPLCSHPQDCNYPTSSFPHTSGQCVGDTYECHAGGVVEPNGCGVEGDGCSIDNSCMNATLACGGNGSACTRDEDCSSGQLCTVAEGSGFCRKTGTACPDSSGGGCEDLSNGTCHLTQSGKCQAPTNSDCLGSFDQPSLQICPSISGL